MQCSLFRKVFNNHHIAYHSLWASLVASSSASVKNKLNDSHTAPKLRINKEPGAQTKMQSTFRARNGTNRLCSLGSAQKAGQQPGSKFLSPAAKVRMREWVELFDEPRHSKFHLGLLSVSELLALKKKCMYTLKSRYILCTRGSLKSWQRPTLHATLLC